jgi:hypothetical protein
LRRLRGLAAAAVALAPGRRRDLVGVLRLDDDLLAAFAVGQPDVVDRVLDAVQAGARGEHPAREDAPVLVVERDLVDLDEARGLRAFGRGPRVADARRHLQRAELHGLVDLDLEGDDPPGDLVEPGEDRGRVLDLVRQRAARPGKEARRAKRRREGSETHGIDPHRARALRPLSRPVARVSMRTVMEKGQPGRAGTMTSVAG